MSENHNENKPVEETQAIADATEGKNSADEACPQKPWYLSEKPKLTFTEYLSKSEIVLQMVVILVTSIMRGLSLSVFAVPNRLSLGGIAGIASILYNALGWNVALTTFVMNIPLLILSYFYINKRFCILTTLATFLTSGAIEVIDILISKGYLFVFTDDIFVAALMSGALTGIAVSWLFKVNCSAGGTDIMGLLVQNRAPNFKVVYLTFFLNAIINIITGIVFKDFAVAIYSFICIFVISYTSDLVQRGLVSTVEVKIITSETQQISDYIINGLHRGLTLLNSKGMFTGQDHPYLICIVRKRQLNNLKRVIKNIDPHAFIYITEVYDTIGNGFDNRVTPSSKL